MLASIAWLGCVLPRLLASDASDGRLCYVCDRTVRSIDAYCSLHSPFETAAGDGELLATADRAAMMAQAVDMGKDPCKVAIGAVPVARCGRLRVPHGVASPSEPELKVGLLGALL